MNNLFILNHFANIHNKMVHDKLKLEKQKEDPYHILRTLSHEYIQTEKYYPIPKRKWVLDSLDNGLPRDVH